MRQTATTPGKGRPTEIVDMPDEPRIYIAYHDRRPVLTGAHLCPIQVGRAMAGFTLPGAQGDETGDNISALNPEYCELTAHYWAWKNDTGTGPVGLMHYRRLFDLSGRLNPRGHPERYVLDFDARTYARDVAQYFASPEAAGMDLIVPRPARLLRPILRQYRRHHRIGDFTTMRDVIAERHPGFLPDIDRILHGRRFIMGNMFIMSRRVLDHYSRMMFDILQETSIRLADSPHRPGGYQRRYLGFLSERIMTAYVLGNHLPEAFPDLRMACRGIANIDAGIPRQAGPLRLARFCLQRRLMLRDALRVIRD